jgi:hypothetical protein
MASREIFYCKIINESIVPSLKSFVCNQPKGWWEYELDSCQFPEVQRTCIIAKTFGNRRLGIAKELHKFSLITR